jgi:hypothetical protein
MDLDYGDIYGGPSSVKGTRSGRVAKAMGASAHLDPGDLRRPTVTVPAAICVSWDFTARYCHAIKLSSR